jgi:hypothetical protein
MVIWSVTYLPLGETSSLNGFEKVLAHKVRILTSGLLGLLPDKAGLALQSLPVELDKLGLSVVSNQTEGVHTESINVTERTGNTVASHCPQKGVKCARLLAEEVPSGVVRGSSLGDLVVATGLDGVNEIREQDGILDEENGNVVSNNIYLQISCVLCFSEGSPPYQSFLHQYRSESRSRGRLARYQRFRGYQRRWRSA